jgi:hypothetical protein
MARPYVVVAAIAFSCIRKNWSSLSGRGADYIFFLYSARFGAQSVYIRQRRFLMVDKQNPTGNSPNEGEGNKTAARQYNEAQQRFAQSGKVEEKAREAEKALDGPEKEALQQAEAVGKRHSAGEDPAVENPKYRK